MPRLGLPQSLIFLAGLFSSIGIATAQEDNFTLSGGYSHIYGTKGDLFHNKDGPYIDADFAWQVGDRHLPLLLGFGLSGSGFFDRHRFDFPIDNNFFGRTDLYSDVGFFEFEPRISLALWS